MNKKLVILGGGTGLSTLLKGIKYIKDVDISAIVSVSDDGKSTGTLRKHFTIPAVGDLRRVISSLSLDRVELDDVLEYRFEKTKTDLDGHAIGNLLIVSQILKSGSFSRGIANTCKMLNVQGQIIPVSNESLSINAEFVDGTVAYGESSIHLHQKKIAKIFYDTKNPQASQIAINAILSADIIIIGIGSLYSSIIPNLIFSNMIESLKKTKAKVCYFSNIFTENGETDDMSISNHINAIENHTIDGLIDEVIINTTEIPEMILEKYNKANQFLCKNDVSKNGKIKVRKAKLLNFNNQDIVRHDEKLVKKVITRLLNDICS
jgi:uncharacterized cofD-like protein